VSYFDDLMSILAAKSGLKDDSVAFLTIILLSQIFGIGFRFITNISLRHYYGIILGITF